MPSKQGQYQEQKGVQIQKHTPQQLMLASLVELPIAGLEERVKKELYENDALEERGEPVDCINSGDGPEVQDKDAEDAGDEYLSEIPSVDFDDSMDDGDLPVYTGRTGEFREFSVSDSWTLIDDLTSQVGEYDLSETQREIISYLIGSLNDNGYIERELYSIVDELAFRMGVYTNESEVLDVLRVLQKFDPPGIGARNMQECLLIQIERKISGLESEESARRRRLELERRIVSEYQGALVKGDLERLHQKLGVSVAECEEALEGIRRLNPRPGMSLSESHSEHSQTVIPDFFIETDGEGNISLTVNGGYVPSLRVDKGFMHEYELKVGQVDQMSKREREAFLYRKQKVESAQMFIASLKQRRQTLYLVMNTIIEMQKDFFLTQDTSMLRPMSLRDVARRAKVDESTVSRVKSSKYALVDGHIYPLEQFFLRVRVNAEGVVVVGHQVVEALTEIFETEDKSNPYSDLQIVELLKERGLDIKHRTVTKYRNQMGVPIAKNRQVL